MSLPDFIKDIGRSIRAKLCDRGGPEEKAKDVPRKLLQTAVSAVGVMLELAGRLRQALSRTGREEKDEETLHEPRAARDAGTAAAEQERPARREPVIFAPRPSEAPPTAEANGGTARREPVIYAPTRPAEKPAEKATEKPAEKAEEERREEDAEQAREQAEQAAAKAAEPAAAAEEVRERPAEAVAPETAPAEAEKAEDTGKKATAEEKPEVTAAETVTETAAAAKAEQAEKAETPAPAEAKAGQAVDVERVEKAAEEAVAQIGRAHV